MCYYDCKNPPFERALALRKGVLDRENAHLASQGLEWQFVDHRLGDVQELRQMIPAGATPFLVLTWMEGARPAYEARHPTARAVSTELSPLPLADSLTKMQYTIRLEQAAAGGGGRGEMAGGSGGHHMAASAAAAAPPGGVVHVAPSAPFFAPPSSLQGPPSYDSLPPALPPLSSFPSAPLVFATVSKPAPFQIEGATTTEGGTVTGGTVAALSSAAPTTVCAACGVCSQGEKFCGECGAPRRR
jgi:hypothetical protein